MNHKKELLSGPWVGCSVLRDHFSAARNPQQMGVRDEVPMLVVSLVIYIKPDLNPKDRTTLIKP